jgi:hypothetical protein
MPSFRTFLGAVIALAGLAFPASSFGFADTAASPVARHAMTPDDIEHLLDVGDPELSPDGKWIAYTVRRVDTKADKNITNLWMVSWDGTQDIQLTYEVDHSVSDPRWSPEGSYFFSLRSYRGS